jgi:hypothetical protein
MKAKLQFRRKCIVAYRPLARVGGVDSIHYDIGNNLWMQSSLRRDQFWGNESENSASVTTED